MFQLFIHVLQLVERSDIWKWLESQLLNATFPKWYYNNMVRPAYVQRFTQNTYNLKLGPVRIRQVRSKGKGDNSNISV